MEGEYWDLAFGSAAGVLTAPALLWLAHTGRELLLKGVQIWSRPALDVSGTWYGPDISIAGASEVRLSLFQSGSHICGTATLLWRRIPPNAFFPSDEGQLRTVRVVGHIQGRFIHLTCRLSDDTRLGVNGFLLEVTDGGRKLNGSFFFYSAGLGRPTRHVNNWLYKDRPLEV